MHPLPGMLLIVAAIGIAFGLMRIVTRFTSISAELSRKTLHIGLGVGCLTFPWLFNALWPVLVLCGITLLTLGWIRRQSGGWRSLLHDVERTSWGELCFPVAVTVLFALMRDPVVDYVVPLLVLTLADAIGALVGVRYGQSRFTTDEGHKSLEGSVAYFVVAFLSTHLCLLLGTDIGRAESILIAVMIGILVMLIEAIAWRGLDNLFIPLATYLLVHTYMPMPGELLLGRIALLLGILLFFGILSKRSYAKDSVLLASALVLYLIWAVGGWQWAIPPLTIALVYCVLCPPTNNPHQLPHRLTDLVAVAGAGLFWLLLSVGTGSRQFDLAFTASWGAQIAMLVTAFLAARRPHIATWAVIMTSAVSAAIVLTPALFLLFRNSQWIIAETVVLLASGLASIGLWLLEWKKHGSTQHPGRPFRQLVYGLAASLLGLVQLVFS